MSSRDNTENKRHHSTDRISDKHLEGSIAKSDISYRPVPDPDSAWETASRPVWRVRFELASDPGVRIGLDVNGEVVLGRGPNAPEFVDLGPYAAEDRGVSRRHVKLRAEATKLFVMDLGSTNGTQRNGRSIGRNTPYSLTDGDVLSLGGLHLIVDVIRRPKGQTGMLRGKAELADALAQLAKAITSQLDLDEVLHQSLEMAMGLTEAGEAAIWLLDEDTGELFLEAERGIEYAEVKRLRLPVKDTMAGEVVNSGKPRRANREAEGEPVKIKTGYFVEALLYAPMTLGGTTFGVVAAAHRQPNKEFTDQDERLLVAIADFTAVAVQNARLFARTDEALAQRVEELAALNELSHAVTATLNLDTIHDVLIQQVQKRWDVEAAALWLVDEAAGKVIPFVQAVEDSDDIAQQIFNLGEGPVGEVAQIGEAAAFHKKEGEEKRVTESTDKLRAASMACVPLKIQDRVVGVLALINRRKGLFSDDDLRQLQSFALTMATAIDNAQLYAASEREREIIHATSNALDQPLMIVGHGGERILANEAADGLLEAAENADQEAGQGGDTSSQLDQLLRGLSHGLGRTTEMIVGDQSYLATVNHAPKVGTITVMQDITQKKKLEQAQAEFVDALSHDLRSPLTSIKGFSQLLQRRGTSDELGTDILKRIANLSDRMLGMVEQLLDIALLTHSPLAQHKPFDLAGQVATAVNDLEGAALARSIELDIELSGESRPIIGDSQRLYRSLLNLVSNAIKFSPEGGQVLTTLDFNDDNITIRVRDEGEGIAKEDLPHIFERFYRGTGVDSEKTGLGLGLAMVRTTVQAHGGEVSVRNAKGGGAEFTITLPASLRVR